MSIDVIVSIQRTGSTYLLELYKNQANIISEPFDPASPTWNTVNWSTKEPTIIKTHVAEWISLPLNIRKRANNVIQLLRKNIFEQCVSLARSRITDVWYSNLNEYPTCYCDRTTFVSVYRHIINQIPLMDMCEYDFRLWYEDLTGDPYKDSKLLNIDNVNTNTIQKLPSIENTVKNIKECKQWFIELTSCDYRTDKFF